MAVDVYLSSVKALAEGTLSLPDAITAADTLTKTGRADLAIQLYHLWTAVNRDSPFLYAAWFNQAVLMSGLGQREQARASLEKAIEHNPDFFPAYINLGAVTEQLGDPAGAMEAWRRLVDKLAMVTGHAVSLKVTALKQIARVLEENHKVAEAEVMLSQCLELDRHERESAEHLIAARLAQCKWPAVTSLDGVDRDTLMRGFNPLSLANYADDPLLHLAYGWTYARRSFGTLIPRLPKLPAPAGAKGKLRIGYLSSDLRAHAVGYLMAGMFALHDRSRFEIFVYYNGSPADDPIKSRIQASVDRWLDIRPLKDDAAAQAIRADGIDILVDLNGHTKGARTKVFGMMPAPINVNWLGYPGTMGTPYHHYLIADDWILPPGAEMYASEKVLRLPCYQPNDRTRQVSADIPGRADVGLPEDAVVFCCFNGLQKLNRPTFTRWMRILDKVPGSVLWILEGHPDACARLRDLAEANGIERRRIIFARQMPSPDHLARLQLADLFLDTFPYGAHTTASDALWMGVPVVTLSGNSFASRVCGSLTRAAGLPELVCETPEQYVDTAIALGHDKARRDELRRRLAQARTGSVLFDGQLQVRRLEELYHEMWADYAAGRLPMPELANLDVYYDIGVEHHEEEGEFTSPAEYRARYLDALALRHELCPIRADSRLWTQAESPR